MAAFGDVILRAAKTVDEEIAKALFSRGTFVRGIHRAKNVVISDLSIEGSDEASETIFADDGVEIFFIHKRHQV